MRRFYLACGLLAVFPAAALAQQRPLRTEDPEPVPHGQVVVEVGVDYEPDRSYPLSGLSGDLVRLPTLRLAFGFGDLAEFQVGAGFNLLWVDQRRPAPFAAKLDFDGDVTTDIEDPVVATKIRLKQETRARPAVSLRVATRFPSAGNDSGLGNDAIDVFVELLAGKTLGTARLAANFGMGVLSVPTEGDRQNDVLTGGLSVVLPVGGRLALLAEANGRIDAKGTPPPGTEDRGQARFGARYKLGAVVLDAALLAGLTDADTDLGLTIGGAYRFQGFGEAGSLDADVAYR